MRNYRFTPWKTDLLCCWCTLLRTTLLLCSYDTDWLRLDFFVFPHSAQQQRWRIRTLLYEYTGIRVVEACIQAEVQQRYILTPGERWDPTCWCLLCSPFLLLRCLSSLWNLCWWSLQTPNPYTYVLNTAVPNTFVFEFYTKYFVLFLMKWICMYDYDWYDILLLYVRSIHYLLEVLFYFYFLGFLVLKDKSKLPKHDVPPKKTHPPRLFRTRQKPKAEGGALIARKVPSRANCLPILSSPCPLRRRCWDSSKQKEPERKWPSAVIYELLEGSKNGKLAHGDMKRVAQQFRCSRKQVTGPCGNDTSTARRMLASPLQACAINVLEIDHLQYE